MPVFDPETPVMSRSWPPELTVTLEVRSRGAALGEAERAVVHDGWALVAFDPAGCTRNEGHGHGAGAVFGQTACAGDVARQAQQASRAVAGRGGHVHIDACR